VGILLLFVLFGASIDFRSIHRFILFLAIFVVSSIPIPNTLIHDTGFVRSPPRAHCQDVLLKRHRLREIPSKGSLSGRSFSLPHVRSHRLERPPPRALGQETNLVTPASWLPSKAPLSGHSVSSHLPYLTSYHVNCP
jgi:hypothetical protein